MNATQCKALMPVLQAWVAGKTIQFKACGNWVDIQPGQHAEFCEPPEFYRIKPEPRHLFCAQNNNGEFVCEFQSRATAEQWLDERYAGLRTSDFTIVEFVEVVS